MRKMLKRIPILPGISLGGSSEINGDSVNSGFFSVRLGHCKRLLGFSLEMG